MGVSLEEYNSLPVIQANKKIWFLNGDLVRPGALNRATGIMRLYNITKDELQTCFVSDFKKNRKRAYTVKQTAELVNRHPKHMPRLMRWEEIPLPMGSSKDGVRGWQIRSYYSEDQVHEIRDILASYHIGFPRTDGIVLNNITPTRQELTRRMGDGILTYTRTDDGRFIPIWAETL